MISALSQSSLSSLIAYHQQQPSDDSTFIKVLARVGEKLENQVLENPVSLTSPKVNLASDTLKLISSEARFIYQHLVQQNSIEMNTAITLRYVLGLQKNYIET